MVLLPKQWKSRSSPGFETGASKNPFAMLKMPLSRLSRSGVFVWRRWPPGDAGWSSPVARQAHNLKVAGSNPAPATNKTAVLRDGFLLRRRLGMRRLPLHRRAHPALDRGMIVEDEFLDRVRPRVAVFGGLHERGRKRVRAVLRAQRISVRLTLERPAESVAERRAEQP